MSSSLYKKLKSAKKPGSGNYFNPGRYLCTVDRVKKDTARDGITYFAIELTIDEVLVRQDGTVMKKKGGGTVTVNSQKEGEKVAHVLKLRPDIFDTVLSNYMGFVLAALALEESDVEDMPDDEWESEMESITEGDGTALTGTQVVVQGVSTPTKAGHDFCKITYEAVG